eukprot:TRINITY_DN10932_c0_g1_i2.p2 TRINITY_DN10932_c0_g1~~TRINITY_DN10932_c0_g1_i2.p2  ORF type:complete len:102 (+),score=18.32 TRINITY_DN10932_c0_g1_i2:260-565(+)
MLVVNGLELVTVVDAVLGAELMLDAIVALAGLELVTVVDAVLGAELMLDVIVALVGLEVVLLVVANELVNDTEAVQVESASWSVCLYLHFGSKLLPYVYLF